MVRQREVSTVVANFASCAVAIAVKGEHRSFNIAEEHAANSIRLHRPNARSPRRNSLRCCQAEDTSAPKGNFFVTASGQTEASCHQP